MRYLESGGGRALLLLHAFPLSADQWLPQLYRLPPGWRAIAPDFRGFRGPSTSLGAGPALELGLDAATMETHAQDVLALMAHLDIANAVIGGLSFGGYVAFALLRLAPERVNGLVLANTRATPDSADALAARDRLIAMVEAEGSAAITREMGPKLLGPSSRREQPDLEEVVGDLITRNSAEGIVSGLRAIKLRPDSSPLLPSIGCPALVISGDEDAIIPSADIMAMQQGIHGARHVAIPRAGHLTNLEAPLAFNEALAEFLNGVPRR